MWEHIGIKLKTAGIWGASKDEGFPTVGVTSLGLGFRFLGSRFWASGLGLRV